MKRIFLALIFICSTVYADEILTGLDPEKDTPVLNEILRQKEEKINSLESRVTTLEGSSLTAATQAQQEATTSTVVYVSPGRQQYHPSAAKAWVTFNAAGSNPTALAAYNASSTVTRNGTGDYTVTWITPFSSANYAVSFGYHKTGGQTNMIFPVVTKLAGSMRFETHIVGIGVSDSIDGISVIAFGDQ